MTRIDPHQDQDALRRVASALRRMQSRPLHGTGCFCCGGGLVQMQAGAIEADLLGLLSLRYQQSGERALHAAVEQRLETPGGPFLDWLGGPASPPRRLLHDLLAIVETASPPLRATAERRMGAR